MRFILEKMKNRDRSAIRNVKIRYLENGSRAEVLWDWPQNMDDTHCFIYSVSEEEYSEKTLEEIIRDKIPEIRDRRAPERFLLTITRTGVRCILFSGKYDRERESYVLNEQEEENRTPVMKVRPKVSIQVSYEEKTPAGIFGFLKRPVEKYAYFICSGAEAPMPGSVLVYRCVRGSRSKTRYGVDLSEFWNKKMGIIIGVSEFLEFEDPEDGSYRIER